MSQVNRSAERCRCILLISVLLNRTIPQEFPWVWRVQLLVCWSVSCVFVVLLCPVFPVSVLLQNICSRVFSYNFSSFFLDCPDVSYMCHVIDLLVLFSILEVLKVRLIPGPTTEINHSNLSACSAVRQTCNKAFNTAHLASYTCCLIMGHIKLWLSSGVSNSHHLSTAHIRGRFFVFIRLVTCKCDHDVAVI